MENQNAVAEKTFKSLDFPLERDVFLRTLIRELSGTLQDVVGLKEASGFVSVVGQNMGQWINENYKTLLGKPKFTREEVMASLVDLKERINGNFFLLEENEDKMVFGNHMCPFEDKVAGRPSMCMMTSNVFGSITADHLGYAKVELQETIANGDAGCRVVVHLKRTPESKACEGREYFGTGEDH